ncbi:hypothetical protein [Maridesulfovibrio sp.]|uniref:hypothetical protein n=1 Tax=Maridesulfovibrio sp. TaxID=2795000 RepID=UPI003B00DF7A
MRRNYKEQQKYFTDPLFRIEGVGFPGDGNEFGRDFWSAVEVGQFCSQNDLKLVKKLIVAIEKMMKDGKLEFLSIHSTHNSSECYLYMFLAYKSCMYKRNGELSLRRVLEAYNSKSRHVFIDLLVNNGRGLHYHGQYKKSKSNIIKLSKKIKDIAKGLKGYMRLLEEDKSANDILFWHVEYVKRKFKLDLVRDKVFFHEFNDFYKLCNDLFDFLIKRKSSLCHDCGWGAKRKGWPFVFKGIGCGSRRCDFNIYLSQQVEGLCMGPEFYDPSVPAPALPPFQFCKPVKVFGGCFSTLIFAMNLAVTYGVYPYELFHLATSDQIVNSLNSEEGLPERCLFSNVYYVRDPKTMSAGKAVSTRYKNVKEALYLNESGEKSNYHNLNEYRIVGLWIWDNLYFPNVAVGNENWDEVTKELAQAHKNNEDNFMRLLKKMPQEEWYLKLEISKIDGDLLGDNVIWEDKKIAIEKYRKHYKLARKCIEQGKVLPLNSVR